MSTARIDPDTRPVVVATTGLVAFLGMVSFAVSFTGLSAVAEWAALPGPLRWAVPVFVDGALLAYTLAVLIQRARGESARFSWWALGAFTAVSVAANGAHVLGVGTPGDWRTYAGASIAAVAPLGVFAATHTLASLVIARPVARPDSRTADVPPVPPLVHDVPHGTPAVPLVDEAVPDREPVLPLPRDTARALRDKQLSLRDIASQMGVSKSTVERWLQEA